MMSSFLIMTACSTASIIESENIIVTNHSEGERYAVRLDDEGNLIQEDINEEAEAENQADHEQIESQPDLSQAASDMVSLDQAQAEFEAGYPDAAAGTLEKLIASANSNEEALELLQEVQKVQKDKARISSTSYNHHSELMRRKFREDRNQDLATANDTELETFQAEANIKIEIENLSENEKKAVQALQERLSIDINNYLFWSLNQNDREIGLEIRQIESDSAITNLIGLFKYDSDENQIQKLNVVTDEYEIY